MKKIESTFTLKVLLCFWPSNFTLILMKHSGAELDKCEDYAWNGKYIPDFVNVTFQAEKFNHTYV